MPYKVGVSFNQEGDFFFKKNLNYFIWNADHIFSFGSLPGRKCSCQLEHTHFMVTTFLTSIIYKESAQNGTRNLVTPTTNRDQSRRTRSTKACTLWVCGLLCLLPPFLTAHGPAPLYSVFQDNLFWFPSRAQIKGIQLFKVVMLSWDPSLIWKRLW